MASADSKKVLIVDDSEFDLIPLEALLTDMFEVEVEQATGGQEAIDKFKANMSSSERYKLVFMDVNMPGVDGLQATKEIIATGAPIKIIGVSSYESDEQIQRCYDSGMVSVISKPLDVVRLQSAFNQHYPN